MNYKAVYRTAPATPGLLNTKNMSKPILAKKKIENLVKNTFVIWVWKSLNDWAAQNNYLKKHCIRKWYIAVNYLDPCFLTTFVKSRYLEVEVEDIPLTSLLKETRRYGPLRRPTSSSCGGLRAEKELIKLCWPILGYFWCPVVNLVGGCLSVPILGTNGQILKNLFFFAKKMLFS